jgi:hypothetical protein
MMDDYIISERPARPTYQDIVRGLADEYSQPRKPRIGGHGESVALPLPAVSGGSSDPLPLARTYTGGYLRSDEYGLIEGTGPGLIREAMQTYFVSVIDGVAVERPVEPENDTEPFIPIIEPQNTANEMVYPTLVDTFRDLVVLGVSFWIVAMAVLIAWLAIGG